MHAPVFSIEVKDADNLDSDRISIAQTQSPVLNQRMRNEIPADVLYAEQL